MTTTPLEPDLFSPAAIDAETAAFNAEFAKQAAQFPAPNEQSPEQSRADREAGRSASGPIQRSPMAIDRVIQGPAGPISLRVFVPDTVRGVYLHLHGGGWTLGRAHHSDLRNEQIARQCQVAVVSVDYRLAPEHPYPAGPDDCEAAALWLAQHARAEFGADRLVIGGESAGAHLAAVTLLRLRDRHRLSAFAAANLVYGFYDLTLTPSVRRSGDQYLMLSAPACKWFADQFVAPDRRDDPDVSPLYADLAGLPPALFTVGTLDPLLDDTLFLHARWIAAGNRGDLAVYPGGLHGFVNFPITLGRRANARIDTFIRQAVGEGP